MNFKQDAKKLTTEELKDELSSLCDGLSKLNATLISVQDELILLNDGEKSMKVSQFIELKNIAKRLID
jgi:hypothetical protein